MATDCGTIWVCTDCMMEHATGNDGRDPSIPFDREPLSRLGDVRDVTLGMPYSGHDCPIAERENGECECESVSFSWSACEGCGSRLGGERHAMTWWRA